MILILDLDGKFSNSIGRRIRERNVYCEIVPYDYPIDKIKAKKPEGIITIGEELKDSSVVNKEIFKLGLPILSIEYDIEASHNNHNFETVKVDRDSLLFNGLEEELELWLNKEYVYTSTPEGFNSIGKLGEDIIAIENKDNKQYAAKFYPEVETSRVGKDIIDNFLFKICNCDRKWDMEEFIEETVDKIKKQVGDKKALCALSGGVDSSVCAALVNKAIGDNLVCVFVDNGLLRKGEREEVEKEFRDEFNMNLITVDAKDRFLNKLKGITDPEEKRKIIGEEFIRVFEEEQDKLEDIEFLVQGTIYSDIVESGTDGKSIVKSHHNVGGLPEDMNFELIEPVRQLFKDEVRKVGTLLGISDDIVKRQPFPGPGLAVRVLREVTEEKLDIVRKADFIFRDEIKKANLQDKIWQYYAAIPDIQSVGVRDGERTYNHTIVLRAISTVDATTAQWVKIPQDILEKISTRITDEDSRVNRVVYGITNKPPATIEWE